MRRVIILISVAFLFAQSAFSNNANFDAGFQQGIQSASALQAKAVNALKQYKPQEVIKSYSDHPKEEAYLNNPQSLKNDSSSEVKNDPTAKQIVGGIDERQRKFEFSKDPNSPAIQNIKKKSDGIYDAITGQFGDCTKKTNCTTTYQTHVCEESPASSLQYCKKFLNIDLIPKENVIHYSLTIHISSGSHRFAGATIDVVNGNINWHDPHDAYFSLSGRIPINVDCRSLQGRIVSVVSKNPAAQIDNIHFPSCDNLSIDVHIIANNGKDGALDMTVQLDMTTTQITYDQQDRWRDDCTGLANTASCVFKEERCVATQSTHMIQGIPVTRDCWEKETTYECGETASVAACKSYRDQGCEQIGSVCKKQEDGGCQLYQQTFHCPIKQCTDVGMICNGQTYCLDGNCIKQQKQADPDFQRAVSALSATHEAAKDFTQFNSIFAGTKKTCDKLALGFLDCCADKGWGKDHIVSCSQEEKDLKTDKDNLLTVYIGEYCKKDPLGICIEHRKAYCVFPSRLARIIQQQGRREQLNINFGDPENVNCRGITREEFAQLDLSKMDFSDFYVDIAQKTHIENQETLNQRISSKIQSYEQEHKPNG